MTIRELLLLRLLPPSAWRPTAISKPSLPACVCPGLLLQLMPGGKHQGSKRPSPCPVCLQAALEFLLRTQRQPDILHCHDWSTADVAKAYWTGGRGGAGCWVSPPASGHHDLTAWPRAPQ